MTFRVPGFLSTQLIKRPNFHEKKILKISQEWLTACHKIKFNELECTSVIAFLHYKLLLLFCTIESFHQFKMWHLAIYPPGGGGGGGAPLYQLDRYLPPQRVWFLSRFSLKTGPGGTQPTSVGVPVRVWNPYPV